MPGTLRGAWARLPSRAACAAASASAVGAHARIGKSRRGRRDTGDSCGLPAEGGSSPSTASDALEHHLAREPDVHAVAEDHGHGGEPGARDASAAPPGSGMPFSAISMGNVTVRSTSTGERPGRVGQHRDLHRRNVGHGVDGERSHRVGAGAQEDDQQHQHEPLQTDR